MLYSFNQAQFYISRINNQFYFESIALIFIIFYSQDREKLAQ
jgi:hypothetical protein